MNVQPKELSIEVVLAKELKKFTPEDELKALAEESNDYSVISVNDKEGYEAVVEQRKRVVKARTGIDKTRKAIKKPVLDYGRDVDTTAKLLAEIIAPAEARLLAEEKKYTDEQERLEKEKEAKRLEFIRIRTEKVFECKPVPTAEGYSVGPHSISRREIELLSDTDFDVRMDAMVEFFKKKEAEEAETAAKLARLAELEAKEKEREIEAAKAAAEAKMSAAAEAKMSTAVKTAIDGAKAEADFDPFDEPTEGKRGVPAANPLVRDEASDAQYEVQVELSKDLVDSVVSDLLNSKKFANSTVGVLNTVNAQGKNVQITIGCVRFEQEFKPLWDADKPEA